MFGSLTSEEMDQVLSDNLIGRIGCHANGKTYVVPVSYAYDENFIYVRSFEGLKLSMMRKNPKVCFQVDELIDMANWKSVIVWGDFEELTNSKERNKGLEKLISRSLPYISSETVKLSPLWPFPPADFDDIEGVVFRIRIKEKSGRSEKMEAQGKS